MNSKNKKEEYVIYEDLVDNGSSCEPIIVDGNLYFLLALINSILLKIGVRKNALVKYSDRSGYELLVKCPFCDSVFYQKKATKKFKCPHCHKKSSIITTKGELANFFFKRVNDPTKDNAPYWSMPK